MYDTILAGGSLTNEGAYFLNQKQRGLSPHTERQKMQQQQAVIPIHTIFTHTGFHLDEVEAARVLHIRGSECFPGIDKAGVRFTEGMKPRSDLWHDQSQILPIGCVPGTRFNDKDKDGKRIGGECTTTLVHKYLQLCEPELDVLAKVILRCDSEAGVKSTELAELIKMAHARGMSNEQVWKWATEILNAIHTQLSVQFAKVPGEKPLQQIFDDLLKKGAFPDDRARRKLEQLVKESMQRQEEITELSFITRCLYRTGIADVVDHIQFALTSLYADSLKFWELVEECKKATNRVQTLAFAKGRMFRIRILLLNTDNPRAIRASRHEKAGGATVTIIRNSRGGAGFFLDNRLPLDLTELVRMIRWLELPKNKDGKPTVALKWADLGQEGVLEAVPQWYYFRRAGQMMNGSLTHPNVEPTGISSQALIDVALNAFHPKEVATWKRVRNIPADASPAKEHTAKAETVITPTPAPEQTDVVVTEAVEETSSSLDTELEALARGAAGQRAGTTTPKPVELVAEEA